MDSPTLDNQLTPEQRAQVADLRQQPSSTYRATVPALEQIIYQPLPVLDHGFIRVIDYMGDDSAIVQAARVSYGKGTRRVSDDSGLLNYLMRNRHTSPFEMCEIKFHVKLPIFVARQWIRHRMANVNEYSARYSVLDSEFYTPDPSELAAQSSSNKQGRGDVITKDVGDRLTAILKEDAELAFRHYHELLNQDVDGQPIDADSPGLARELARIGLPLSAYTQWYWKIDLHNLLHFVGLRADQHAQWEIRAYAEVLLQILERWLPLTHQAFLNYRLGAVTLSAEGLDVTKRLIKGEKVDPGNLRMSAREWRELKETLQLGEGD